MDHATFSVTVRPIGSENDLSDFSAIWNAPLSVKIIRPSLITEGPITVITGFPEHVERAEGYYQPKNEEPVLPSGYST